MDQDSKVIETDLSDEELAVLARTGDPSAIEALLVRYRGYVRAKAGPYFLAGAGRDDVVQEGMIGLWKAVRDFRPGRQTSFQSFAGLCITRQIVGAVRSATCRKHSVLNDCVSLDQLATDEVPQIPSEGYFLERDYILLSALESEVFVLYAGGRSYREIANTLGRSMKSVDNALRRIRRKIDLARSTIVSDAGLAQAVEQSPCK